ncbi:MAG: hypothetical protein KatS3mg057_1808 [Herpetosiphonaceae bacterium]|nr:MAG: hypothetical protein KatS3mg057_1808 [Herpetosiphonaceae bacterium]
MPSLASIQLIDEYWSSFLGCSTSDLYLNQTLVVPHSRLTDYKGALVFRRGPSCIISVPTSIAGSLLEVLRHRKPDDVFNESFLQRLFGSAVDRIVGPAWLGYADATDFHPREIHETRLINAADEAALRMLAQSCGEAWEHSAVQLGRPLIFGCFVGDRLIAAGSLERYGPRFLQVGVVTHPAYRGRGYGTSVASAATQYALESGNLIQCRVLESNVAAVAVAHSLGYHKYAATFAIRLLQGDLAPGKLT